jgi:hypothetical protein
MTNAYYNHTTYPATGSQGSSALARAEFDAVTAGFDLLPTLTGNAGKFVTVNAGATALTVSPTITDVGPGTVTITGNLSVSGTITGTVAAATVASSFNAGLVGTPGFFVVGDTNTGFWSPGAEQLAVSTNGVERMRWDANGNTGVGTTASATNRLHVLGNAQFDNGAIILGGTGSASASGPSLYRVGAGDQLAIATGGSERFRMTSTGDVSLSTTTAAGRLTVASTSAAAVSQVAVLENNSNSTGTGASLGFVCSTTPTLITGQIHNQIIGASNYGLIFSTYASSLVEQMRIDGAGNVGFNQPSVVNTAGYTTVEVKGRSGGGGGLLKTTSSDAVVSAEYYVVSAGASSIGVIGTSTAHPFLLATGGAERMRLDVSGNVTPGANNTQTLGSAGLRWSTVNGVLGNFSGVLTATGIAAGGAITGVTDLTTTGNTILGNAVGDTLNVANGSLQVDASGNVIPSTLGTQNFGSSTNVWNVAFAGQVQSPGAGGLTLNAANGAGQVILRTNGGDRIVVTSDGRFYGTGLHNSAGAVTGTTNQYIASGTYTPTFTNNSNISASSAPAAWQWIRVGNVVTVSGLASVTVSAAAGTATDLAMTLPIASTTPAAGNIVGTMAINGVTSTTATQASAIFADTINNRARIQLGWNGATGPFNWHCHFTYVVL